MPDTVVILRPPLTIQNAAAQPTMPVKRCHTLERPVAARTVAGALTVRRDTPLAAASAFELLLRSHRHQPVTSDTATPRSRITSAR